MQDVRPIVHAEQLALPHQQVVPGNLRVAAPPMVVDRQDVPEFLVTNAVTIYTASFGFRNALDVQLDPANDM